MTRVVASRVGRVDRSNAGVLRSLDRRVKTRNRLQRQLAITDAGINMARAEDIVAQRGLLELGLTDSGKGAGLIGFADPGGDFEATTVEAALAELAPDPGCFRGSGTNLTTTVATVNLSATALANDLYALSGNELTISTTGTYWFSYQIQAYIDSSTGSTRAAMETYIEDDQGGYAVIAQSYAEAYLRELADGSSSGASFPFVVAAAGTKVRLRAILSQAIDASVHRSMLSIHRLGSP